MHQFHAVLVHDVLEERHLADDDDKFFTSIPVLVDLSNVARGHGLVERHVDSVVNATEPRGSMGHEGNVGIQLAAYLTLILMVR